jgi:hypothetical protein
VIKQIPDMPPNVVALTASGQVTGDDYKNVIIPLVDGKIRQYEKIRLLYHLGADFKKFTTTALWDDAKIGFHHLQGFERVAVVSDVAWIRTMARGIGRAMPMDLRTFANSELEKAKAWITA